MTLEEFLEVLASTKEEYLWRLVNRPENPSEKHLRCLLPTVHPPHECCPITAVTYKLTGKYFDVYDFMKAAELLSLLNPQLVVDIVRAADTYINPWLRAELLKTLELKEE